MSKTQDTKHEPIKQPEINDLIKSLSQAFGDAGIDVQFQQLLDKDIEQQIKGQG